MSKVKKDNPFKRNVKVIDRKNIKKNVGCGEKKNCSCGCKNKKAIMTKSIRRKRPVVKSIVKKTKKKVKKTKKKKPTFLQMLTNRKFLGI